MSTAPLLIALLLADPAPAATEDAKPAATASAGPESPADTESSDPGLPEAGPAEPEPVIEVTNVLLTVIEGRDVPAREAGLLSRLLYREGDIVKPDAELGRIDDNQAVLAAKRAAVDLDIAREKSKDQSAIQIAEKNLELAEDELRRTKAVRDKVERAAPEADLYRDTLKRDVAALEIDRAQREHAREQLNARLKEADLEIAQEAVERRRILAPIGGMVVQVHRRPGEWVEPSEPVLRLLRMDELRAEAVLDANVATRELLGRPVTVYADLPDRTNAKFTGEVVFVSPEINPGNPVVRVWVHVANPELELRPGLRVRMTILGEDVAKTDAVGETSAAVRK